MVGLRRSILTAPYLMKEVALVARTRSERDKRVVWTSPMEAGARFWRLRPILCRRRSQNNSKLYPTGSRRWSSQHLSGWARCSMPAR